MESVARAPRHVLASSAFVLLLAPPLLGQELPDLPEVTAGPPYTLIEAEGESFPPAGSDTTRVQADFDMAARNLVGTPARSCTRVGAGPTRSGDFLVGGTIGALRSGKPSKVWWKPLYGSRTMELLVRGRRLDSSAPHFRWTNTRIAFPPAPPGTRDSWDDVRNWFFPSEFTLTGPGEWLIVATSGPNWGCFILTVS